MSLRQKYQLLGAACFFLLVPFGVEERSCASSSSSVEIDQVIVTGVTVFKNSMIESAIEVSPGDQLDRHAIVKTEENLQALYRSHGYEEASIKAKLVRKAQADSVIKKTFLNQLKFSIFEGRPARISEISFIPEGSISLVRDEVWLKLEKKLKNLIGILPGDILNQERLVESKRIIQEYFVSNDYMGAGVNQIETLTQSTSSKLESSEKAGSVSKWIKLQYHVDLGDQVSFGFRGNSFFTWGYLEGIADDQRSLGLGKDYLDVIRRRLEDEYRSSGFVNVSISFYTIENLKKNSRKVIYDIREGVRAKIDSVDFDGNLAFTTEKLRDKFFSKASGMVQNRFYVEKDVEKAAELLVEWMKEKGYLSSKLVTINRSFPPQPKGQPANSVVRLVIYVYEGNQTLLGNVDIRGATVLLGSEIKALLKVEEGKPLNLFALVEGLESLKRVYKEKGYLNFQVKNEGTDELVRYSHENRMADVSLILNEGPQFKVSKILFEGLATVQPHIIQRELLFHEKDIAGESLITGSERQLRKLGIFSSVSVRAIDDPENENSKIIVVKVQESDRGILTGGPGIRNDLGIRAFGQFTYSDLWGENHTVSLSASANRRLQYYNFAEGQVQLTYLWPWFVFPGLNFRPSIALSRVQYFDFQTGVAQASFSADDYSGTLSWDKLLLTRPNLVGSIAYSYEYINQFNASNAALDNGKFGLSTITPQLVFDLRDNPILPTSGFYGKLWFDAVPAFLGSNQETSASANKIGGDPVGLYRVQFRTDYHLPITKKIGWYFSFRTGFERSVVPSAPTGRNPIPLIKQFALGGVGSLRGYNENELNTVVSRQIQGQPLATDPNATTIESLSYINFRTQVDFPISGAFKGVVFLDVANLLINTYSLQNLLGGAGAGLRYQSPVGSFNLDWGFKLNPLTRTQSTNVLHFSVGVI